MVAWKYKTSKKPKKLNWLNQEALNSLQNYLLWIFANKPWPSGLSLFRASVSPTLWYCSLLKKLPTWLQRSDAMYRLWVEWKMDLSWFSFETWMQLFIITHYIITHLVLCFIVFLDKDFLLKIWTLKMIASPIFFQSQTLLNCKIVVSHGPN